MITTLENQSMSIKVKSKGAELASLISKKDGCEYLWQGNPDFWGRQSPVLFPIVGRLKDNTYFLDGQAYSMTQHGFARDYEFDLVDQLENKLIYKFRSNEETRKIYPFNFELYITYELTDSKVIVGYQVKNVDEQEMYFSIGAHPGFNCPWEQDTKMEDYYLEFEQEETAETLLISEEGLRNGKTRLVLDNEKVLPLSHELFRNDALIFEGLKSNSVTIKSHKSDRALKFSFEGFPYLGIWTQAPPVNAPFICIEPWYGMGDIQEGYEDFKCKKGVLQLEGGKDFACNFSIEV